MQRTDSPSMKRRPADLSPQAVDLWAEILTKYADEIYNSRRPEDQWAKAIRYLERMSKTRGIRSYTTVAGIAADLRRIANASAR